MLAPSFKYSPPWRPNVTVSTNSFRFSVSPHSPELQETKNPSSPPPPRSAHRQIEQFQDGHHVRLRSREHGMYLHANKDGRGVSLRRPRASMNAAWAVHLYQDDNDAQYVLLHSAAYGGYLAAMDAPAPLGHCGRRVEQRDYEEREEEAVRWRPVRFGSGDYILLRHASGRFLRANGKYLPWNNGASVDDFDTVSTMTHWVVERIPAREGMPELPLAGGLDVLLPRRWIVY
ncbi:uncharacterized protein [Triticum aestivum]|uniref:uncharacterized protein n=1 Tax=Triticum aestivum TaxID=4565 RepID=UPI001D0222CE|nr:uncharacterized protein LOC123170825 [Triticum aestivum]